jgi:hypothetical protein
MLSPQQMMVGRSFAGAAVVVVVVGLVVVVVALDSVVERVRPEVVGWSPAVVEVVVADVLFATSMIGALDTLPPAPQAVSDNSGIVANRITSNCFIGRPPFWWLI